jgi:ribosomal protein S19E (S16A)
VVEKEIKNIDDENQIIYKGRVITPAGHKLLDEVARETRSTAEESYPELKDY